MDKIKPCLWFDGNAEEAVEFYVSLLPDSRVDARNRSPMDWPGGKAGGIILIEFTLAGRRFQALNGGPFTAFNEAVSLSISCRDQGEVDRLWAALLSGGGAPMQCGWLKDRFGLRWQIVPEEFERMLREGDAERAQRAMTAMLDMVKLDMAALRSAWEG